MGSKAILRLTDCVDTVDFLNIVDGVLVCEWKPAVAPWKDGGVWQSSPLADGKRLAYKNYDNAVETFILKISGRSEDAVIAYIQSLTSMLEKAVQYWMTGWQKQPVWIEARGSTESNTRYAVVKGYKIDELANPFSQPFFGGCKSLMEITLVIERDHWIDHFPGTSTCLEINNLQEVHKETYTDDTFMATSPADDISYRSVWGIYKDHSRCGFYATDNPKVYEYFQTGLRFPNITIPRGSEIFGAYIYVRQSYSHQDQDLYLYIQGELTENAPQYSDSPSDFLERIYQQTNARAYYKIPAGLWSPDDSGDEMVFDGIGPIVQEIIDQYGWVSGNALSFFFVQDWQTNPIDSNYLMWSSVDSGFNPLPKIEIFYRTPNVELSGREDTCTGKVYVSNKHTKAQVNLAYINGAGSNLIEDALPYDLLPNPVMNGDYIYYGISADSPFYGPFDSIAHDLITIANLDVKLKWQYPNSVDPTWENLKVNSDASLSLHTLGESVVNWIQPIDWAEITINGILGYWIRVISDNPDKANQGNPPRQANRTPYSVVTPYIDIDGDDIKGEIPASARIRLYGVHTGTVNPNCVVVGLRSKSRGINFTPYLNCGGLQNDRAITINYPYYSVPNTFSPTGRCISFWNDQISEDWESARAAFVISKDIASEYVGTFHVYARYSQTMGNDETFNLRLAYALNPHGPFNYSKIATLNYTTDDQIHVADLGIIEIGQSGQLADGDHLNDIYLELEQFHNVLGMGVIFFHDLILMPADEWMGVYRAPSGSASSELTINKILDIDAIGNPRSERAILRNYIDPAKLPKGETIFETFNSEWMKTTRGGPILQVNSDQRLWFTTMYASNYGEYLAVTNQKMMAKLYSINRYLTMRGTG